MQRIAIVVIALALVVPVAADAEIVLKAREWTITIDPEHLAFNATLPNGRELPISAARATPMRVTSVSA